MKKEFFGLPYGLYGVFIAILVEGLLGQDPETKTKIVPCITKKLTPIKVESFGEHSSTRFAKKLDISEYSQHPNFTLITKIKVFALPAGKQKAVILEVSDLIRVFLYREVVSSTDYKLGLETQDENGQNNGEKQIFLVDSLLFEDGSPRTVFMLFSIDINPKGKPGIFSLAVGIEQKVSIGTQLDQLNKATVIFRSVAIKMETETVYDQFLDGTPEKQAKPLVLLTCSDTVTCNLDPISGEVDVITAQPVRFSFMENLAGEIISIDGEYLSTSGGGLARGVVSWDEYFMHLMEHLEYKYTCGYAIEAAP